MQTNKIRYLWIDIAKLVSIFGVVYIHGGTKNLSFLVSYFSFCVPVFVIASFFLIERLQIDRSTNFSSSKFLQHRLPRLILPYVTWSIIYLFINHQSSYSSITKFITLHWTGFGWSGQYYLLVLLQLTLIYPLLRLVKITPKSLLVIGFITLLCLNIPFDYLAVSPIIKKLHQVPFLYWIFYAFFGICVARNYVYLQSAIAKVKLFYCVILMITTSLVLPLESFMQMQLNLSKIVLFIGNLVVAPLLFLLFMRLNFNENQSNFSQQFAAKVSWLSTWTLGVFCLNPLIYHFLGVVPLYQKLSNLPTAIAIVGSFPRTLLVCTLAVILSWLINRLGAAALVK